MSMLNQAAVEALCSATYLETYLECMDSLPEEMQRFVSVLREMDGQCNDLLIEIEQLKSGLNPDPDAATRKRTLQLIQRNLIKCQELGDEKIQIVSQIIEVVENRSRQLHQDLENLDPIGGGKDLLLPEITPAPPVSGKQTKQQPNKHTTQSVTHHKQQQIVHETPRQTHVAQHRPSQHSRQAQQQQVTSQPQHSASTVVNAEPKSTGKRQRRQVTRPEEEKKVEEKEVKPKKKKKRKVKKEKASSPMDIPIDPDEPTYCLCDQVSYGEMIGCDNEECKIEWFHFNCVNLNQKPKGKWYCPNCRGETSKVPRKDLK